MTRPHFLDAVPELERRARKMLVSGSQGKPEENTKDKLLNPLLEALGYDPEHRTLEGDIKSLRETTTWVDYFLLPERTRHPVIMVEAKSLWDTNIWQKHKQQVLDYLRDYKLMIGHEDPVLWLVLTNFREWYVLRLEDREPFWSFTIEQLLEQSFADEVFERLARENLSRNRLQEFYTESRREELGTHFLADLKTWRLILANGIRVNHPSLSLQQLREVSQVLLNRFLFVRLLEAYGQEQFYSLARLYSYWKDIYQNKSFAEVLADKFEDTWKSDNTELFTKSLIDRLDIPPEFLEPIILLDPVPQAHVAHAIGGPRVGYRSIYNYDFHTITQDVLGTAYEQFLAHELIEQNGFISILENQRTRKREGVYYTPNYIVCRIVHQTLQPVVKPKIDRAIGLLGDEAFQDAHEQANSVFQLRIVDFSCGSGSFLLGAFDYLIEELYRYNQAVQALLTTRASQNDFGDLLNNHDASKPLPVEVPEERILIDVLYGVDLDPQAISLAKLSLWTRLLRARPGRYGLKQTLPRNQRQRGRKREYYTHLPTLALNIRCGNSLIRSPATLSIIGDELAQATQLVRTAKNRDLDEQSRRQAADRFEGIVKEAQHKLAPYLTPYFATDESLRQVVFTLRGQQPSDGTSRVLRAYLLETHAAPEGWGEQELNRLKTELMASSQAQKDVLVKRPFNWELEFPDLFDLQLSEEERGFDIVIGNPPYFNVDATFGRGAPELAWLKTAYSEIHTDKTDVLFYFIRQAFHVLRKQGQLAFIASRAFIQADKAKGLRRFLARETTLLHILDFLGHEVFDAGIATCIVHAQHKPSASDHVVEVDNVLDFDVVKEALEDDNSLVGFSEESATHVSVFQDDLGEERWSFGPYRRIFSIIDNSGDKLRDLSGIILGQGMQTGENAVFILSKDQAINSKLPMTCLRLRVSNTNIHQFGAVDTDERILYVEDETYENLPGPVQRYLNKHETVLKERAAYQRGNGKWYCFTWPLHKDIHFRPKIMLPYRASGNCFAVDEKGKWLGLTNTTHIFCENSTYDPFGLCALLNAKVLEFRYRALGGLGKLTGRGMFEYFENQVGDLPIPRFADPEHNPEYQRLSELGRDAHELFNQRYRAITAFDEKSRTTTYQSQPFWIYHDPVGNYGELVQWESPHPNREGHLLGLRVEALPEGYKLWGEVSEDEDWREGEREWVVLAKVAIHYPPLRRYLLARAVYLTEFDEPFQRKQKLTAEIENLTRAAFQALTVRHYDDDQVRNLKMIDRVETSVVSEAGRSDIETILLCQKQVEQEINAIAYRIYGVEEFQDVIEAALRVVL